MMKYRSFVPFPPADAVPQDQRLPGTSQLRNDAGGYVFAVDDWARLDRFLVLGAEGGTYYVRQEALTVENAEAVLRCIATDGARTVARIVEISRAGRAPKQDPAIFALALCAKLGDDAARALAYAALPAVCRTGSQLMAFVGYAQGFGGWGRGMRRAVAGWFNRLPARELAYQVLKYQARDGWSSRDLLRLAHPRAASPAHDRVFAWVTRGVLTDETRSSGQACADEALAILVAHERAVAAQTIPEIVALIRDHALPREAVPTHWLVHAAVWEALLPRMPMTAMIRNLATMTKVGLLTTLADATSLVTQRLGDEARLRGARVHPIAVLAALTTYQGGKGVRGDGTWRPVASIVDALDGAFYQTFATVEPSQRRTLLALDVSGSMTCGMVAGVPGLTPRVASAAMALITAATERDHAFVAFTAASKGGFHRGRTGIVTLPISPRQRLGDAVASVSGLPFGGTDCSLPMIWAEEARVDVDTFVIYTDNETWAGSVHPCQALRAYRQARGIPARVIVVGMTSNGFTIADPSDAGMLDVVGFDASAPAVIADFARA